ncbi:T9SS type A sorting domain-containing protein [candidate division WOR-3 bacterium]|nr:T9SS type A sorting domain-containing protein [candidate division WOR-3 bacterium]
MSKKSTLILILTILLIGLNLFAADISYNLARDVAYYKAVSVFGNLISLGFGIPYYDIEDNLMGYEFGISLVGKFPDDSQIFAMVREKRLILNELKSRGGFQDVAELKKELAGIGKFGSIFVSANSADFPVPEYGEGLPHYYLQFDEAKEYAWDYVEGEPSLVCMYYLTPYLKWYKFSANGEEVYVRLHGSRCKEPDDIHSIGLEKCPDAEVLEAKHRQLWKKLKKGDFSVCDGSRAGYIDSVPEFDWCYGCSPTASAMVMAYWDERGYDRLLDWYWNHVDPCGSGLIMNTPNVQQELAVTMGTDTIPTSPGCGGTNLYAIAGGHVTCANSYNGYSFSASTSAQGNVGNDFVWSWITGEIDAGRPFNWSLNYYWFQNQFIHHSTTVYGYTDDKYCILYNTWMWGEQHWYYYTYHGGVYSKDWVITAVPGGGNSHKVTIVTPDGGEIWQAGSIDTIKWTTDGGSIDHLKIDFTKNGGNDWQTLTTNAPNTGSYTWNIQPDTLKTYRAKIRLFGYNSGNSLLGADGSEKDFTIQPAFSCTVTVTSPNGGEVWGVGEVHPITWTTSGTNPHHVMIYYSADGGLQWNTIITYPNTGSFNWTVPDDTTSTALVMVKALTQTNELIGEDISDNPFSIVAAGVEEEASVTIPKPFSVFVSPVPMTDFVRFTINKNSSSKVYLYIVDITGRIVRTQEVDDYLVTWDGKDNFGKRVRSGLYIYKIHSGEDRATGKIIKIR